MGKEDKKICCIHTHTHTHTHTYIYIYNGILFSHRKNAIVPFETPWMDFEGIMLGEISRTETNTV